MLQQIKNIWLNLTPVERSALATDLAQKINTASVFPSFIGITVNEDQTLGQLVLEPWITDDSKNVSQTYYTLNNSMTITPMQILIFLDTQVGV